MKNYMARKPFFLDGSNENADWAKRTWDFPLVRTTEQYLSTFYITNTQELKAHIRDLQKRNVWDVVPSRFKEDLLNDSKMANLLAK